MVGDANARALKQLSCEHYTYTVEVLQVILRSVSNTVFTSVL